MQPIPDKPLKWGNTLRNNYFFLQVLILSSAYSGQKFIIPVKSSMPPMRMAACAKALVMVCVMNNAEIITATIIRTMASIFPTLRFIYLNLFSLNDLFDSSQFLLKRKLYTFSVLQSLKITFFQERNSYF